MIQHLFNISFEEEDRFKKRNVDDKKQSTHRNQKGF